MCAAVSPSRSAATRAERRSAIGGNRQAFHQSTQRQLVTVRAESADDRHRRICERRATTLRLARVNVGEMHFHERNLYSSKRIANGEARVAVRSRIHQRPVRTTPQSVHCVDDLSFSIMLRERELNAKLFGDVQETRLDVAKSFGPVEIRLARAEQIEVGAIDYGDPHSPVSPSSQARNFATSSPDSCVAGMRGFTRGVGIGGVGGVLDVPVTPLKAPASRDAARLSAGFTVAPANTASREALGTALPIAAAGASGGMLLPDRVPPPPLATLPPDGRGGRRRPSVAKNSLIDG